MTCDCVEVLKAEAAAHLKLADSRRKGVNRDEARRRFFALGLAAGALQQHHDKRARPPPAAAPPG